MKSIRIANCNPYQNPKVLFKSKHNKKMKKSLKQNGEQNFQVTSLFTNFCPAIESQLEN
jgi:hypothetical protein